MYTSTFTNTGTLEATNGGRRYRIYDHNQNGTILSGGANAGVKSAVQLYSGADIQGGTLTTTGGGTMGPVVTGNNSTATLMGVRSTAR